MALIAKDLGIRNTIAVETPNKVNIRLYMTDVKNKNAYAFYNIFMNNEKGYNK